MQRRHFASAAAMAAGLVLLSGCTSTQGGTKPVFQPVQYATAVEAMAGSPSLRRAEVQKCLSEIRATPAQHAAMARLMNLRSGQRAAPIYCQRLVTAYAEGRISYQEYRDIRRYGQTPKMVRILQNR